MAKLNSRQEELKKRIGAMSPDGERQEPKMVEMEVDVDAKDFDTALDETITKAEALVDLAPDEEKAEKLSEIVDLLKNCKAGYPDEDVEAPAEEIEGGANEVPPINLG